MRIGSTFSGIGGLEIGLEAAIPGAHTVWQIELEEYPRRVLSRHWPHASRDIIDIREANKDTVAPVDLICGGFPCQDISLQSKMEGFDGKKSSLYFELARLISEIRPRFAILENVSNISSIKSGGVQGRILSDLAQMGYNAEWGRLGAAEMGAAHRRWRWFLLAWLPEPRSSTSPESPEEAQRLADPHSPYSKGERVPYGIREERTDLNSSRHKQAYLANSDGIRQQRQGELIYPSYTEENSQGEAGDAEYVRRLYPWEIEPNLDRVVNGVQAGSHVTNRLRCLGNAVVPQCAYYVGLKLMDIIKREGLSL